MSVPSVPPPSRRCLGSGSSLLLAFLVLAALPGGLAAQPFGEYLGFTGGTGRVVVPHSPALNPTSAFTFEAWINLSSTTGCHSIAGKGYREAWWVAVCNGMLRSYLKGNGSLYDSGFVPTNEWTHVAVVFDGVHHTHYIDGELVGTPRPESGPLTTSTNNVEIGGDVDFEGNSPNGYIDEVRLWNVARTQAQIRSVLQGFSATTPHVGLVAFWPLNGNENDIFAGHNGSLAGSPTPIFPLPPPVISSCSPSPSALCLGTRFLVTARFRVGPQTNPESPATPVACANPDSGLFWFFSAANWEVMVKTIDACGLNSAFWVFSAATTNVFYRMEVYDVRSAVNRIYFNYPGPPAPAVTDVNAFATCP
jgi:hypothetical protein